ncbi:MAG: flagellar basal body rod protein FlgC [Rickettsiales bacterium]|nr:flagellar basal body rod protein FlgC [Pseudomonadota bacterium]MDA0965899.1 flagellar basal body rod protein FlgC [Pseudomonadota bacterium]MDG4542631.1 flagellar basal body rod protein FlgC [Rickettsiales bacterium]MDG4545135.1 flagellar basal body rod protein FlgC [Rickettsiales bacterium]MDG4547258.1 flagellar basal body rod protein FlgC [Rickettsiales bacterium]
MRYVFIIFVVLFPSLSQALGLDDAFERSTAGMKVQSQRMKIISQNIANADSVGTSPDEEPYRRKTIYFKNTVNPKTGNEIVEVDKLSRDYKTPFKARFDPSHPAADEDGYILLPNVNRTIENVDMKEAERSYEANLGAVETTKRMYLNTLELLR